MSYAYSKQPVARCTVANFLQAGPDDLAEAFVVGYFMQELLRSDDHGLLACPIVSATRCLDYGQEFTEHVQLVDLAILLSE